MCVVYDAMCTYTVEFLGCFSLGWLELQFCKWHTNNPLLDLVLQLCTNPVQHVPAECSNIHLLLRV